MNIKFIKAEKVSNGWTLTVYDADSNRFTTTVHVSAEQLVEKITDLLFPPKSEKEFALHLSKE